MQVWIDGDACPARVKEFIYKASERTGVSVTLVANAAMRIPHSPKIRLVVVSGDFDAADHHIVANATAEDLVVTADVPLASELIDKGAVVINSRGTIYTPENVKDSLSVRNLMQELRGGGIIQGGPSAYGDKDFNRFANSFDRELTRLLKKHGA